MARRTSTAWVVMEKPPTRASPEEGGNSVVSILMVVVLPAPLEPSKAKTSPALTERVRESTAVNEPKRRVRSLISRTSSLISESRRGSSQLHHHLTDVLPLEKTDERLYRPVDSFHDGLLVLHLAGFEIAAHFLLELGLAVQPIRNDETLHGEPLGDEVE